MKIRSRLLGMCLIWSACASPLLGFADTPDKPVQPKHPAKAAPRAPLSKPQVMDSVVSPASKLLVKPAKPPVVTAVSPKRPVGANNGALNTQPIPPGTPVPVDPIHRN